MTVGPGNLIITFKQLLAGSKTRYNWLHYCALSSPLVILVPVSSNMGKIVVFVVRHGERGDEALYNSGNRTTYKNCSREDKVDPSLTVKGHRQAEAALTNLVSALTAAHIRRVAVFASPMRRALGTIMMLASAIGTVQGMYRATTTNGERENIGCSGVSFALPLLETGQQDEVCDSPSCRANVPKDAPIIPVVVHNGLCDCTALVGRLGGHKNVLRAGLIRCAAMVENSMSNRQSPIQKELVSMTNRAVEALGGDEDLNDAYLLQFWKIQDEKLLPMTQPMHLDQRDLLTEEHLEESQRELMPCPVVLDDSESPIDQVVRMAMNGGCDACVVA